MTPRRALHAVGVRAVEQRGLRAIFAAIVAMAVAQACVPAAAAAVRPPVAVVAAQVAVAAADSANQPASAARATQAEQQQLTPHSSQRHAGPQAADGLDRLRAAHRSTAAAMLMSVPVPGWGQLYSDSPFWGAVAFGAQMFYMGNFLVELRRVQRQKTARDFEIEGSDARKQRELYITETRERARDFVWWSVGGMLLVSLDAYVSVALVDFNDPGEPIPDLNRQWDGGSAPASGNGGGGALQLSWRF